MAINVTKQPSGIYPGYNDAYIEFNSDLVDNNKAEITLSPASIFPKPFVIYPDLNGIYLFNLKEAVKVRLNDGGFTDDGFDTSVYWKSIEGVLLSQFVRIDVFSDSGSEFILINYDFFKGVKQIGERIYDNESQLLTFTEDGINHSLTYWEGFPFSVDILKVGFTDIVTVKNTNTGVVSDGMLATSTNTFRLNIDRGEGNNWTSSNFLPLMTGRNELDVRINGDFKSNLNVIKKKKCSGVYLKWHNRSGGYSHYLFDEFFVKNRSGKSIGKVLKDEFANVGDSSGIYDDLGKEGRQSLVVKAKYNDLDHGNLEDLISSPHIQMYTSRLANIEGVFIDVEIEGSMSYSNKRGNNNVSLIVELPELITQML